MPSTHIRTTFPTSWLKLNPYWDTAHLLFARGLLPRDWLPTSEIAEVRMWESHGFSECATSANHPRQQDSHGEQTVSHELASCSCAKKKNGTVVVGSLRWCMIVSFSLFNLNTNPFLNTFPRMSVVSDTSVL